MSGDTVIYHSLVNHYTSMFVFVRVLLVDIVESGEIIDLSSFLFINVLMSESISAIWGIYWE